MKKKFVVLICLMMVFSSYAGESIESESIENMQDEIQVKIGMFPLLETVICAFVDWADDVVIFPLPVFTAEYLHYLTPYNGIGASFTIGSPIGPVAAAYFSLGFTYRRIYLIQEKIKLYGELGIGGELLFFDTPFISAHFTPLGILWGSNASFGIAEFTFGTEGSFLTMGIGKRF